MKNLIKISSFFAFLLLAIISFIEPSQASDVVAIAMIPGMAYGDIGVLPTPQQKLAYIAAKLGSTNVDDLQVSQRTLIDTLPIVPLTGNTILNFFDQVGQRGFPATNVTDNKLGKGEAIIVQRVSFGIIIRNTAAPQEVIETFPFCGNVSADVAKEYKGLYASQFSLKIGSSEVIKKMSLLEMYGPFNKGAKFNNVALSTATAPAQSEKETSHDVIYFDSFPGITENNEFVVSLQIPPLVAITPPPSTSAFIFCKLEGIGCVYSPSTKY
ncbi:MAG: hypothetical protein VKL39_21685 [Leptolyngbyaceae bacterium]|nr:hypothetical protein [Leptolyngbyaceae bacterium]